MDYLAFLKVCGGALLAYAFIFFVALRIQGTPNYIKKSFLTLIVGVSLTLVTGLVTLVDLIVHQGSMEYYQLLFPYLGVPLMALISTIVITLVFFIIGKKRHQQLKNQHEYYNRKMEQEKKEQDSFIRTTRFEQEERFLYIAFIYEDKYLLKKIVNSEGKEEYGALAVKIPVEENFHDVFLEKLTRSMDLDVNKYEFCGTAKRNVEGKKPTVYYVYSIELNEMSPKFSDLEAVSPVVLYGYNLSDFNKKILFHIILKEHFDIEL